MICHHLDTTWVALEGGSLALGHRPKLASLADLRAQGCTALVTLLSEREGAKRLGAAASNVGIHWLWVPLESGVPPADERDAEMRVAFTRVWELLKGGGRVLLHCSAGIHRTGMIAYGLFRHLGHSPESSKSLLRDMRTFTAEGVGEHRLAWGERFGYSAFGNTGNTRNATGT